jgi:hypothetical protein
MTDDELEARLRRLDVKAAEWDATSAVRAGYEREVKRRATTRRRRWSASVAGTLAMAAALALWLRGHHTAHVPAGEPIETFHVFEDLEPGEMLEELSPADVDRVAKAFNKGA